jgi:hypothetical protein
LSFSGATPTSLAMARRFELSQFGQLTQQRWRGHRARPGMLCSKSSRSRYTGLSCNLMVQIVVDIRQLTTQPVDVLAELIS